jgi:hypothetical protein
MAGERSNWFLVEVWRERVIYRYSTLANSLSYRSNPHRDVAVTYTRSVSSAF